jgi:hypothetical protein
MHLRPNQFYTCFGDGHHRGCRARMSRAPRVGTGCTYSSRVRTFATKSEVHSPFRNLNHPKSNLYRQPDCRRLSLSTGGSTRPDGGFMAH